MQEQIIGADLTALSKPDLIAYTCDSSRYGQEKMSERPQCTNTYMRTASEFLTNPDLELSQVYIKVLESRISELEKTINHPRRIPKTQVHGPPVI